MSKLEPTYLRYIYDELGSGTLNSDNASFCCQLIN